MIIVGLEHWDLHDIGRECGNVSHTTVYGWLKDVGFPPPVRKIGRTRYWLPEHVMQWFDEHTAMAA